MQIFHWTQELTDLLVKLYPTCTMDELIVLLGISSAKTIRLKAQSLGLKKDADTLKSIRQRTGKRNMGYMHTDEAKKNKMSSIKKMIRLERIKIKYGLKQKTKRVFSPLTPREQRTSAKERYYLRKYGYIIDNDNKKLVYYTDDVKRDKKREKHYEEKGYTFQPFDDKQPIKSYDPEPMPYTIII